MRHDCLGTFRYAAEEVKPDGRSRQLYLELFGLLLLHANFIIVEHRHCGALTNVGAQIYEKPQYTLLVRH